MTEKQKQAEASAREQVGDGKLPNRYWVSASSHYLTNKNNESNSFDSAYEIYPDLPQKSEMLGVYDTFKAALRRAHDVELPSPKDEWDAFHSVSIEDRLTGVLYDITWWEYHTPHQRFPSIEFELRENDDTQYTKEHIEKQGGTFQ